VAVAVAADGTEEVTTTQGDRTDGTHHTWRIKPIPPLRISCK